MTVYEFMQSLEHLDPEAEVAFSVVGYWCDGEEYNVPVVETAQEVGSDGKVRAILR